MSLNIHNLLRETAKKGASDLHLTVGMPPMLRLDGELAPLLEVNGSVEVNGNVNGSGDKKNAGDIESSFVLSAEDTYSLAQQIMNNDQVEHFRSEGEADLSYSVPGGIRVRANVYRQKGHTAIALRIISEVIPDLKTLGMPDIIAQTVRTNHQGLILVTGPTGSGKTTTLASMLDLINRERRYHIITLEDPVEYLFSPRKSMINQREVGHDSRSFASGLRAALRQDPDVILVGEMRDLETISIAITAAETGHLVLATLHTIDAPQTIDRIIDVFPPHQQQQVRVQLANTLVGIVSQKLLKHKKGRGRVAATEVLVANDAIRNLIREGKIYQVYSAIQTGGRQGMHLMDTSLQRLYENNLIDYETAMEHAATPHNLSKLPEQNMKNLSSGGRGLG